MPEATDKDKELFGNDRMLAALNEGKATGSMEGLLKTVRSRVDEFVGEAPQFDDLTMMVFEYKGNRN